MVMKNVFKYVVVIFVIATAYLLIIDCDEAFYKSEISIESEFTKPFYIGEFNSEYYIGDYSNSKFFIKALDVPENELKVKYETGKKLVSTWGSTCEAGVFLMESYIDNGNLNFRIIESFDGNEFRVVYSDNCIKIPNIYLTDDNLFINYVNYDENNALSLLVQYDINNNLIEEVDCRKYFINEDGTIKGSKIVYAGGEGRTLYYQIICANNETLEEAGKVTLVRYSLDEDKIIDEYLLDNKAVHISGTSKFIIISEYDYNKPLYESGKILLATEDGLIIKDNLKNVESGNDIMNSRAMDDNLILFSTPDSYNVYDFKKGTHLFGNCSTNQNKHSDIKISNNKFSYLESNDDGLTIHNIEYKY